ncbi:MAG: hypothetical protein KGL53_09190, partial [Elusimicrobia bacterium]|nr:hypothetical protein [Elusimicrobiota bacterium]
ARRLGLVAVPVASALLARFASPAAVPQWLVFLLGLVALGAAYWVLFPWLFALWFVVSGDMDRGIIEALAGEVLEPGWTLRSPGSWELKGTFRGRPVTLLNLQRKDSLDTAALFMECRVERELSLRSKRLGKDAPDVPGLERVVRWRLFGGFYSYGRGGLLRVLLTPKPNRLWGRSGLLLLSSDGLACLKPGDLREGLEALCALADKGL